MPASEKYQLVRMFLDLGSDDLFRYCEMTEGVGIVSLRNRKELEQRENSGNTEGQHAGGMSIWLR